VTGPEPVAPSGRGPDTHGRAADRFRRAGGLTVLHWPVLDALGVDAVVTTRHGGVSTGPYDSLNLGLHVGDDPAAVVENRRRAAAAIGADLDDLVVAEQVHGRAATVVDGDARGRGTLDAGDAVPATDVLVTTSPGTVLVTLVADCVPTVLFDPVARVLATVHAGWRGTADRVVVAALDAMNALGARPTSTVAGIGPAVSPDTYQVGEEVHCAFERCFGDRALGQRLLVPVAPGRWLADLSRANLLTLLDAGVPAASIHLTATSTGPDGPFFSDRAARPCGRFALLARIRA
jgi:polyphenol oxidase